VIDAAAQFGMVEQFHYAPAGEYPGKATVIFYKNGIGITLNGDRFQALTAPHAEEPLRYMEAELNCPIVNRSPGQTYAMDTQWNPVRIGKELVSVMAAGVCAVALQATRSAKGVQLRGKFAVLSPGYLEAQFVDGQGAKLNRVLLDSASVDKLTELDQTIVAPDAAREVSIHLIDTHGKDCGALATAKLVSGGKNS
jgi:hypothetical protein